jgi:hypothetical protein
MGVVIQLGAAIAVRSAQAEHDVAESPVSTEVANLAQRRVQSKRGELHAALDREYYSSDCVAEEQALRAAEAAEHLAWWRYNVLPLKDWTANQAPVGDWQQEHVLAPLLDSRRKGSTLRKQLALLAETGDYRAVESWLDMTVAWLQIGAKSNAIAVAIDHPYVLRTFAKAGLLSQFVPRLAYYSKHITVGTDPAQPGPALRTTVVLPLKLSK